MVDYYLGSHVFLRQCVTLGNIPLAQKKTRAEFTGHLPK